MQSPSIQELARLLALRTKRDVASALGDTRLANINGQGLDFSELREYTPADDARHIHWPSAMSPGPISLKQFQEEHTFTDVVAVDISASMTSSRPKWDLATRIAAILCAVSTLYGNGGCLMMFDDRVESRLALAPGARSLGAATSALLNVPKTRRQTDLPRVLQHLRNALKKPTRIFIVTDLAGHDYMPALTRLAFAHDLTVCHVFPSLVDELPAESAEVEDAELGTRCVVSPRDHAAIRGRERAFLGHIRQDIQRATAKYLLFTPAQDPLATFRE